MNSADGLSQSLLPQSEKRLKCLTRFSARESFIVNARVFCSADTRRVLILQTNRTHCSRRDEHPPNLLAICHVGRPAKDLARACASVLVSLQNDLSIDNYQLNALIVLKWFRVSGLIGDGRFIKHGDVGE